MAKKRILGITKKPISFAILLVILAASAYVAFKRILPIRDVVIILLALFSAMLVYKIGKTIIKVIVFLVVLALVYWLFLRRYLPLSFL